MLLRRWGSRPTWQFMQIILCFQMVTGCPCCKAPARTVSLSSNDILLILPQDLLLFILCPEIQTGPHPTDKQLLQKAQKIIFPYKSLLWLVLCLMYLGGCIVSSKVLQDRHWKPASAEQGSQSPELTQQLSLIFSDQIQCRVFCCL